MGFFDSIGNVAKAISPAGIFTSPDLVGDALTGGAVSNARAQVETNRENMAFSERMSSTAYQRGMDDMRKAGLNPMLAFSQGGASAPTGQSQSPRPGDVGGGLFNSAKQMAGLSVELPKAKSETELNTQQAETQKTVQPMNRALAEKATANAQESEANKRNADAATRTEAERYRKERANANAAERDNKIQGARQGVDTKVAPAKAVLEMIGDVLGVGGSAKKVFQRKGEASNTESIKNPRDYFKKLRDKGAD